MNGDLPQLCGNEGCRRLAGHAGHHHAFPGEAWDFVREKDKRKLGKAGFATPRGGAKGAYQNHVGRSSKVIIPYERVVDVDLNLYQQGYVIRLLPEQFFEQPGVRKAEFASPDAAIRVGTNAFVLYRTHDVLNRFPPLGDWQIRTLVRNGIPVVKRGNDVQDLGHYVLRIPRHGERPKRIEGPPQGVFAPEYADDETNFLCKCVLAWLIIKAQGSPYTMAQAAHLRSILCAAELDDVAAYERRGVLKQGLTACPLCTRLLRYSDLHETVSFNDQNGLINAAEQIEGATRSTVVNLFHLMPLLYHDLTHVPGNIGWGHAICNTRLGQRPCYSSDQLMELDRKVGVVLETGEVETFGWISDDWLMIRSPNGAVWIQLNGDVEEGPPIDQAVFDKAAEPPPPEYDAGS
jgi:hypothetical protein